MKTKILSLLFLTANASFVLGQENVPAQYKKDIGLNTSFIFSGIFESSPTPFSFMYKSYNHENRANRFGANISMSLTTLT